MRALFLAAAALTTLSVSLITVGSTATAAGSIDSFEPLASLNTPGEVAEIVAATPDGNTLFYTNAGDGWIGVVDITNPAAPSFVTTIEVDGEPTSVDISADGEWAIAAVITRDKEVDEAPPAAFTPGQLVVIDVATRTIAGTIDVGAQPDSLKLLGIAGQLTAIVAIENEPYVVEDGVVTDGEVPGLDGDISGPGLIQVVEIDTTDIAASVVTGVELPEATLTAADCFFPDDPQAEFVALFGTTAAVSLQENNCIAILDLTGPTLTSVFSTGIVDDRPADLVTNDTIDFADTYPADVADTDYAGARFPDAIQFSPDGAVIYSANEGEFDFTGGRGISAWSLAGDLLWDDEGSIEAAAVRYSHYADSRSDAKGVEMEGAAVVTFDGTPFLLSNSERGAFVAVYTIADPKNPQFVQILPTGIEPEGIIGIPSRGLFVTSDEVSGTITIFGGVDGPYAPPASQPILRSAGVNVPWCAVSGFDFALDGSLHAVPDNAAPSQVYRIAVGAGFAEVTTPVTILREGEDYRYDGEGIVIDTSVLAPANEGWWIASEGNAAFGEDSYSGNVLIQVDASGAVLREVVLPAEVDSAAGGDIRSNGYEGLALSEDGRYIYAAIQRQYADESAAYTRIARVDLESLTAVDDDGIVYSGDWEFYLYPLETAPAVEGAWSALSEITLIGDEKFAVIERDNQISRLAEIKKVYAFDLAGIPDGGIIQKVEWADVLDEFAPYEKIESLTVATNGDVWAGLDNDCGEVQSRVVNLGALSLPALPVYQAPTPTPATTATATPTATTPVASPSTPSPAATPTRTAPAPLPPDTGAGITGATGPDAGLAWLAFGLLVLGTATTVVAATRRGAVEPRGRSR